MLTLYHFLGVDQEKIEMGKELIIILCKTITVHFFSISKVNQLIWYFYSQKWLCQCQKIFAFLSGKNNIFQIILKWLEHILGRIPQPFRYTLSSNKHYVLYTYMSLVCIHMIVHRLLQSHYATALLILTNKDLR